MKSKIAKRSGRNMQQKSEREDYGTSSYMTEVIEKELKWF